MPEPISNSISMASQSGQFGVNGYSPGLVFKRLANFLTRCQKQVIIGTTLISE
ncbi:MAG: hypothetical protein PXX83_02165 [Candidatus Nitrosotalea sp.]|nr:hypothetical protein [Candidatus Nitrosotalea sp.]